MKATTKHFIYGTIFGVFLLELGIFFYGNVIVPWPYRHELKACLEEARSLDGDEDMKREENLCFRKYPHFN